MPQLPEISCKELTAQQLKEEITKRVQLTDVDRACIELLKEGKIKAFLKPDGEITYQYKPQGNGR